mmetsp:Transcript_36972/g.98250  ORF Transcript_36972/g.98250 Transcript_36972/m.98250 type:complete len:146 (-) Transcript_36972:4161-4598(-)
MRKAPWVQTLTQRSCVKVLQQWPPAAKLSVHFPSAHQTRKEPHRYEGFYGRGRSLPRDLLRGGGGGDDAGPHLRGVAAGVRLFDVEAAERGHGGERSQQWSKEVLSALRVVAEVEHCQLLHASKGTSHCHSPTSPNAVVAQAQER